MSKPLSDFSHLSAEQRNQVVFYASLINDVIFDGAGWLAAKVGEKNGYKVTSPKMPAEKRKKADAALAVILLTRAPGGLPPEALYVLVLGQYIASMKWEKLPEKDKKNEPTPQIDNTSSGKVDNDGNEGASDPVVRAAGTRQDSSANDVPPTPRVEPKKKRRGRPRKNPKPASVDVTEGTDSKENSKA